MPKRKNPEPLYPVLEAEIAKRGILKKQIAEEAGIDQGMLSKRLVGKTEFMLKEALAIQKRFFPDMSVNELFEKE